MRAERPREVIKEVPVEKIVEKVVEVVKQVARLTSARKRRRYICTYGGIYEYIMNIFPSMNILNIFPSMNIFPRYF